MNYVWKNYILWLSALPDMRGKMYEYKSLFKWSKLMFITNPPPVTHITYNPITADNLCITVWTSPLKL